MQAYILSLHAPSTPFFFLNVVMLYTKSIGMEHRAPCNHIFFLYTHPGPVGVAQKVKTFLSPDKVGGIYLCVHSVRPSVHTFCLSGTISQYLCVIFDSLLVQIISTIDFRYPISLVKIDPLTLELLPLF